MINEIKAIRIISNWRKKYGFDHECYKKQFDELYKNIKTKGDGK